MDPYGLWHQQPFVVFDVETTGLEDDDRVVEVGFARFDNGRHVDSWGSLVYPNREIPQEATAIHGISTTDVADAPPFAGILPRALPLLRGAQPVAYNASFDRSFWERELGLTTLSLQDTGIPIFSPSVRWIDPLVWVRHARNTIWKGNKLTEACARFGVQLDNAHRATDDAVAAGKLLLALVDEIGQMTTCELLRQQQPFADAQQQQFDSWRRKKQAQGKWRG